MSAKFEARDIFKIHGRGHVLSGWVREGVVKIGMRANVPGFPQPQAVLGIERFSMRDRQKELEGMIGLLFAFGNETEETVWKNLALHGQMIDVE